MDDVEIAFKEYAAAFKRMEIPDKRKEIINNINEMAAMVDVLATKSNIELSYLKSSDISALKDGHESEDEYLNALLVYVENAKSLIGQYFLKVSGE